MKKEDELKKYIWDDVDSKIKTADSAQLYIWGFLVTINLAYFVGIYQLLSSCEKIYEWLILLSTIILVINFLLFIIYIREHNWIQDSIDQQKKIYNSIIKNYNRKGNLNWIKFHEDYNDKFSHITYFVVILLFTIFILLPQLMIYLFSENQNLKLFLSVLIITLIFILWFAYWCKNKEKRKNFYERFIKKWFYKSSFHKKMLKNGFYRLGKWLCTCSFWLKIIIIIFIVFFLFLGLYEASNCQWRIFLKPQSSDVIQGKFFP